MPSTDVDIDSRSAWRLSPDVSLRDESFGALAYHHGTRRLIFVKSVALTQLVKALGDYPSLDEALAERCDDTTRARFRRSLASLAKSGIICER